MRPFLAVIVLLLGSLQISAAVLRGLAKDGAGAAIAGASITVSIGETEVGHATSAADGSYSVPNLAPGQYIVSASAANLRLAEPRTVSVGNEELRLDLVLTIVVKTQQMEVKGAEDTATVSVESSSNAGATVIKGNDLNSLADNPDDLQSDLQAMAGPAAGPSGGTVYIDGFSTGQIPPKESIREVRINQDPYAPEFDKLGYGRIEILTKPGSSKWNGSLGFNFANDIWNSRNPFAGPKAPLLLRETENTFGGPLGKKASFSVDVEQHSVDNGSVVNGIVLNPTTLLQTPYSDIVKAFQRRLLITPRVDYQLNDRNVLTFRYNITQSSVDNFGIGQFDLPSRGYRLENRFDTFQVSENYLAGSWVNDIRYQFYRWDHNTIPDQTATTVQVLGAFTNGGAQVGRSSDTQTNHEFQDYVSVLHGAHTWRFGVRLRESIDNSVARASFNGLYTFSSIDAYQITEQGLRAALSPSAIRAAGGGASQYSVTTGIPGLRATQFDPGVFVGDNWHLRPNLLVNLGLRYENQTNISDNRNFAPRIGIAWSPRPGSQHSTVLRAGFGIFYDRFALADTVTALRYNGMVQHQYVLTNPDTYPAVPDASQLPTLGNPEIIQRKSSRLSAPYLLQSAITLEHQLTSKTTVSASYMRSRAVHVLRSLDINAPLPGSGLFPFGTASPIYLMTSSGVYNQNQMIASVNAKPIANVSLFGYYVLNKAMSDSDGLTTFPANPYNYSGEYGPAATDIRHRVLVGGSIATRWNLRFSPYVILQSGAPFDITTGRDLYGTAMFNTRPGLASGPGPDIIATKYGYLNPNPTPDEPILSRNAGRGPGVMTVNLRVSKTFGFGSSEKSAGDDSPKVDATKMSSPGGLRGLFGSAPADHRYNLTVGVSARNLTNHTNPGPIVGNVTSPLFGRSNQIAGGPNAEGFSEAANNRRFELQMKFTF
jgi:Carboxypeptidase regulatory-like domain